MTIKGFFKPINPLKYKGDPTNIVFRSQWEQRLMSRLDRDENVEWWQSEELPIPYMNPAKGRIARYFVDFVVRYKNGKTVMIEIKPFKETQPPIQRKNARNKLRFVKEAVTYAINIKKWEAATAYAKQRGWDFQVLTEREAPWLSL